MMMRKSNLNSWLIAKHRSFLFLLGLVISVIQPFTADAANGRVIDKVTGKPMEGVFVTAQWFASVSGIVNSGRTSCYHFAITQTDKDGKYELPEWSWVFWPFHYDRYTAYDYYYPYYVIDARPDKQKNAEIEMRRYTGASEQRMTMLAKANFFGCGSAGASSILAQMLRARLSEAKEIAKSPTELEQLKFMNYIVDKVEKESKSSVGKLDGTLK
jgi:hypothetical protein